MHGRGHQPLRPGERVPRLHGHQFPARELEGAHALFPGLADALRIGLGKEPPGVIGVHRGVIHGRMHQIGILPGHPRNPAPGARIPSATKGIQPPVHRHVSLPCQRVFFLQKGRQIGRKGLFRAGSGTKQHSGNSRMAREMGKGFPPGRNAVFRVDGAKRQQEFPRMHKGRARRRREPREAFHVFLAPDGAVQHQRRQIGLQDFRRADGGHAGLGTGAPEPIAYARRNASGTPRPLGGHIQGDSHRFQVRKAAPRVEDHLPAKAAVHHYAHAFNGEGGLGDGCGKDHLPLSGAAGGNGPRLLVVGKKAVERIDGRVAQLAGQKFLRLPDLPFSRQESQDIARMATVRLKDGFGNEGGAAKGIGLLLRVHNLYGEHFSFAFHYGRVQGP